uniref:Integration host factor subunit beta n=1 Tax=candidate division WOR-3 bacterium TaxID=2052148 RepID=A0A7V3ZTP9_UNCW3
MLVAKAVAVVKPQAVKVVNKGKEGVMTITKQHIVDEIVKEISPRVSRKDVYDIVQIFLDKIIDNLAEGNRVELRGFGIFNTKLRKPKIARNPKTNEPVSLPPRRVPVFKASKIFKEALKGG